MVKLRVYDNKTRDQTWNSLQEQRLRPKVLLWSDKGGSYLVLYTLKIFKMRNYIDVPDDYTLPIGVEEVVAFRITTNHFGHPPLHLWETGKHVF